LVLWFFGSLVLWFFGSLVLWFFGSLVLWFFGSFGSLVSLAKSGVYPVLPSFYYFWLVYDRLLFLQLIL
jgi:hypothetical protein